MGIAWTVPPLVGNDGLPTSRLAGAGKGPKPRLRPPWLRIPLGLSMPSRQIGAGIINPVQIPIWPLDLGGMPTAGKAPSCGLLSTGRSRHDIPGVTLPLTVILTAHRLRSPRRPARQTASDFCEPVIKPRLVPLHAMVTQLPGSRRYSRCRRTVLIPCLRH